MRQRTVFMQFSSVPPDLLQWLGGIASGALGLEVLKRWLDRREKRRTEQAGFEMKILDEGDKFRETLLEECRTARVEARESLERAHKAEVQVAVLTADNERLKIRLERKDEEVKGLKALVETLRGGGRPGGATAAGDFPLDSAPGEAA